MRSNTIRALAGLAVVLLSAGTANANPSIVVDAASGQVLLENEATRPWIPASTTKLMTAYLALKAIKEGKARLDSPLQVSALAARQRPVKMYLKPGQIITLDNALKIMLVKSANDLAYVVAEGIGGSVPRFSDMMNAEARRLGMHESHFVNPNGWDAPGHQSSARDLAILARAILRDFPDYEGYFGIGAVALGNKVIKNTNGLIGRYPGVIGMKTGFVCASGFNVVGVAERGGRRLIAVVLGAGSGAERTVEAARLLDEGFTRTAGSGTLEALAASQETVAPNVCHDLRRRGVPLQDDSESDSAAAGHQDFAQDGANPAYATLLTRTPAPGRAAVASQGSGGRIVLGPRAEFDPLPVYLGRAPGSNAPVLAGINGPVPAPSSPTLPANALALAPPESAPITGPKAIVAPSRPVAAAVAPAPVRRAQANVPAAPRGKPLSLTAPATSSDADDAAPETAAPAAAPTQAAPQPAPAPAPRPARPGKLNPIWPSAASQGLTGDPAAAARNAAAVPASTEAAPEEKPKGKGKTARKPASKTATKAKAKPKTGQTD